MDKHLTTDEIEQYVGAESDDTRHVEIEQHLIACNACRARVARDNRMNAVLRALPRAQAPRELAARIGAMIETHMAQEQTRRARVPYIAIATLFSILLALWFCLEAIIAFQENDVLDFFTVFTSYLDSLSPDSLDALIALIEALPITELVLTLCALLTVVALAQQLADSLRPRAWQFK